MANILWDYFMEVKSSQMRKIQDCVLFTEYMKKNL